MEATLYSLLVNVVTRKAGRLSEEAEQIGLQVRRRNWEGCTVWETTVQLESKLFMIDAMMSGLLTELRGAYCLLCNVSHDTACGMTLIEPKNYFRITRTASEIKETYEAEG